MSKGARAGRIVALLAALALLWLGERLIRLPEPRSEAGAFSATRAAERLGRVLGNERPHPVDSPANDAVRARIVAELEAIGLRPVVDDGWSCNGERVFGTLACARVRNIRATVGAAGGRHLLVVSHYDSTAAGPGAADDGIGVATMLETAALLSRRELARPVTFLFNEGEESGLLGARAFLARDPLAGRVHALVNLEARGVEGPAIMFETSRPNGAAVGWLRSAVSRPVANSLATDFYRLIPNSTDVRVFSERPWTILNFAIIGNETRYHAPGDTLAALDRRSLQHMGDQLLALATAYGEGRAARGGGEQVFTDLWGLALVRSPSWLSIGGLALAGLLLAVATWRTRAWRGLAGAFGALLVAAGVAWLALGAIGAVRPGEYWRAQPDAMSLALILTALLAAVLAVGWAVRGGTDRARAGAWLLFASLGAGATAAAPGASIFFAPPALIAGVGLLARGRAARWLPPAATLLLLLAWAPLVGLLEVLLDFDAGWIFAALYALLLVPVLIELGRIAPTWTAGAATLAGWALVAILPAYSADRKQAFGIEYVVGREGARWMVVNDDAPLPSSLTRLAPFRPPADMPWSGRPRWAAPAPGGLAPMPTAQPIDARGGAEGRTVRLRLGTAGADSIGLQAPAGRIAAVRGPTTRLALADRPRFALVERPPTFFRCLGRTCDGLDIEVEIRGGAPVPLDVVAIRAGLPRAAAPLVAARPANAAPQYGADATVAISRLVI